MKEKNSNSDSPRIDIQHFTHQCVKESRKNLSVLEFSVLLDPYYYQNKIIQNRKREQNKTKKSGEIRGQCWQVANTPITLR